MAVSRSAKLQKLTKLLQKAYKEMGEELPARVGYGAVNPYTVSYVKPKDFYAFKGFNRVLLMYWYYSPLFSCLAECEIETMKDFKPHVVMPLCEVISQFDIHFMPLEDLDTLLFSFALTHQAHVSEISTKYKLLHLILNQSIDGAIAKLTVAKTMLLDQESHNE